LTRTLFRKPVVTERAKPSTGWLHPESDTSTSD
jgi:hypothetical protein